MIHMAKNLKAGHPPETTGLMKFRRMDWKDPAQIDGLIMKGLNEEELALVKFYLRTLAEDETLTLSSFEMKRIAVAMLTLDRGDKWFLAKEDDNQFTEYQIQLQQFLSGKEELVLKTMQKARDQNRPANKSLWDQLDADFKTWEVKGEGVVEGIAYTFETKKKKKPQMLKVQVDENSQQE